VTEGVRKCIVASILAALLAVGVSACGGGDDDSTATTSPAASSTPTTGAGGPTGGSDTEDTPSDATGKAGSGGDAGEPSDGGDGGNRDTGQSGGAGGSQGSSGSVATAPLRVSGGGSAPFRVRGGDNSIQDYGSEADEPELEEAARVLHGFLVARAEEDWTSACSYFSASMVRRLEQLAAQSPQLKDKGCAAILDALTTPISGATQKALTEVDAASLRREGDQGFLLYHGDANTKYFMPMTQESGAWKVGALAPSPFP
jgi:hypothetical protein